MPHLRPSQLRCVLPPRAHLVTLWPIVRQGSWYVPQMTDDDVTEDQSEKPRRTGTGHLFRSKGRRPGEPPTRPLKPGLNNLDLADFLRQRLYDDRDYARNRRMEWRLGAVALRLLTVGLGAAATVTLGLADLDTQAAVGFALTAIATVLGGLEAFFNWRSRWVAAEEALASWHHIEEALALYVSARPVEALVREELLAFDDQRRDVWSGFSRTWVQQRKGSAAEG